MSVTQNVTLAPQNLDDLRHARSVLDAVIEGRTRLGDGSEGHATGRLLIAFLNTAANSLDTARTQLNEKQTTYEQEAADARSDAAEARR